MCVCVAATWPAAVTAICLSCLPVTSSPSSIQHYGTTAAVAVRAVFAGRLEGAAVSDMSRAANFLLVWSHRDFTLTQDLATFSGS